MPTTCCVPGCKSNYKTEKETVKVFQFPSDEELRKEWLKKIPRKDWVPSKRTAVCIKHFFKDDIVSEDRIQRPDGTILVVKRTNFKLKPRAVPFIFENLPKYLTHDKPVTRKDPDARRLEHFSREENKIEDFLADDIINSFEELKQSNLEKDNWCCVKQEQSIFYYKINASIVPVAITSSFVIRNNLSVEVYINQTKTPMSVLSWLFPINKGALIINRWSQLENIFPFIENSECLQEIYLENIIDSLHKYIDQEEIKGADDLIIYRTKFLAEQLFLSDKNAKARRYSPELLAWAFSVFTKSPVCYKEMYSSGCLSLPHVRKLTKLSSLVIVDGKDNSHYLKAKAHKLESYELFVNLLLDEIIVRPQISYDSKHMTGFSSNKTLQKANSVQSFMITSIYSHNKDVIALIPVKNLTAKELLSMTESIIKTVTLAGYKIISIISDNNRINRNMMTELCGGELKTQIPNPFNKNMPMFMLFDSVHLLKSIRNNWINQKSDDVSLVYPDPDNLGVFLDASFETIRALHRDEKLAIVKSAPRLNDTALYPSSVERQNVNLCLRIFHDTTVAALKMIDSNKLQGTIKFLEIVLKWWRIVNVKNLKKGFERRENDSLPFSSINDERLEFLSSCSSWLKVWREVKIPGLSRMQGKLSAETFFALNHTVRALREIIIYLIDTKNDKYVLTGTFQTDHLEGRFGQYRQLNGGNHNLSVLQVLKSEKKLRISSLLKLHSESYGKIPITNFLLDFTSKDVSNEPNSFDDIELKGFYVLSDEEIDDWSPAIYLSGYAVCQLKKRITCYSCLRIYSSDKDLLFETNETTRNYFSLMDKGGLMYPSEYAAQLFLICYKIFQCILRRDNEHLLLLYNIKELLVHLALKKVEELNDEQTCSICGGKRLDLTRHCINIFFNIFLNNYSKVKNDVTNANSYKRKYDVLYSSQA